MTEDRAELRLSFHTNTKARGALEEELFGKRILNRLAICALRVSQMRDVLSAWKAIAASVISRRGCRRARRGRHGDVDGACSRRRGRHTARHRRGGGAHPGRHRAREAATVAPLVKLVPVMVTRVPPTSGPPPVREIAVTVGSAGGGGVW